MTWHRGAGVSELCPRPGFGLLRLVCSLGVCLLKTILEKGIRLNSPWHAKNAWFRLENALRCRRLQQKRMRWAFRPWCPPFW